MRATALPYDSLPDPGERFTLGEVIRTGVWAKVRDVDFRFPRDAIHANFSSRLRLQVVKAIDIDLGKTVAIKIQSYTDEHKAIIDEEYRILRDFSEHPNLLSFYGAYRAKRAGQPDDVWLVLEVSDCVAIDCRLR